jgi:hypothetical protein
VSRQLSLASRDDSSRVNTAGNTTCISSLSAGLVTVWTAQPSPLLGLVRPLSSFSFFGRRGDGACRCWVGGYGDGMAITVEDVVINY